MVNDTHARRSGKHREFLITKIAEIYDLQNRTQIQWNSDDTVKTQDINYLSDKLWVNNDFIYYVTDYTYWDSHF